MCGEQFFQGKVAWGVAVSVTADHRDFLAWTGAQIAVHPPDLVPAPENTPRCRCLRFDTMRFETKSPKRHQAFQDEEERRHQECSSGKELAEKALISLPTEPLDGKGIDSRV